MRTRRILCWLLIGWATFGCDNGTQSVPAMDAGRPDLDPVDLSASPADATPDQGDAADMACNLPLVREPSPTGRRSVSIPAASGIDAVEHTTWLAARRNLLASPGVHFVATYHHDLERLIIVAGEPDAPSELTIRMGETADEPDWVIEGDIEAVFPNIDASRFPTAETLWQTFENPMATTLTEYGYTQGDPRVGFLPAAEQFFPLPFERLMTLFAAENAPDLVYGLHPFAARGVGTHGGLSGLQSRAPLIVSGPGVRRGVVVDEAAALVDIAPTVLASLGAPTKAGQSTFHEYDDGLYLRRQDGRVLTELRDPAACYRPEHAVVIIFDGLQALEINRQLLAESPDLELPNFQRLAQQGTIYRYGALSGFPSYSAPGHSTVGTGAWPGHHGVLGNRYFHRGRQEVLTPFDLITGLVGFIMEPERALELYRRLFSDDVENLAQATHGAFGNWDAEAESGAFVAVINELTFLDADFSTLSFLSGGSHSKALPEYRVADGLAITQVQALLNGDTYPVPRVLQLSFLATDAAGESDGPHSPLLREILEEVDERLGIILDAYERRGAFDKTLFVLTADHGMELQDPERRADVNLGVRSSFRSAGMVYLKTIDVTVSPVANSQSVMVSVRDHDHGQPIPDAAIRCARCVPERSQTDLNGTVELQLSEGTEAVEMEITHPGFNRQTLRFRPADNP